MLDKTNFSLFKFRAEALNLSPMEKKYNITLPPLYKIFLEVYSDESMYPNVKRLLSNGTIQPFARIEYYSLKDPINIRGEYAFEKFYSPETAFKMAVGLKGHWYDDEGYMHIAEHGWGTGFAVGVKEHNLDKIFYIPDTEEAFFLEDNIFKFISKFEICCRIDQLKEVDTKKLYKNYGETFWRLRKDEENI